MARSLSISARQSSRRAASVFPRGDIAASLSRTIMAWKVAGVISTPPDAEAPRPVSVQMFGHGVKHVIHLLNALLGRTEQTNFADKALVIGA